jgi:polar amino acid transport system ATP-binding protein
MTDETMIELADVHKSFGANHVLRGITGRVDKGEVVCIIGPSGSGKSTILRCINALETYDSGEIRVDGQLVDHQHASMRAIRTQVSMVVQRFNLFPHRTALENVIEGPVYVKREPREAATERGRALLARVGLADKAEARPAQLSGGQMQRGRKPGEAAADDGHRDFLVRRERRRRYRRDRCIGI